MGSFILDLNVPESLARIDVNGPVCLLFSGGVDSYVGLQWLHKIAKDFKVVYFDLGTKYSKREIVVVKKLYPKVVVSKVLKWLGKYEGGVNAFIPFRNLFVAMVASLEYASNVMVCGIKGDDVEDKNKEVFKQWSIQLSTMSRKKVTVFSPFWGVTKSELVYWYLMSGGSKEKLLQTVSCYSGKSNYCGACPSCFRKFVAFKVAGIAVDFRDKKLAREYFGKCKSGHYDYDRAFETLLALKKYYDWE